MTADNQLETGVNVYEASMAVEDEKLPSYLSRVGKKLIFEQTNVIEGGDGEFDWVWDFGGSKNDLRLVVPAEERITESNDEVTYLAFDDPDVAEEMAAITDIANDPSRSFENSSDRKEYRDHLSKVYRKLAGEVKKRVGEEKALYFAPKNGGIFVQDVYEDEGVSENDFFDYRMSRVLVEDNEGGKHLNVAANFAEENPNITDYRTFVFTDDCLASDISSFATLDYLSKQLKDAGIDPSGARVIVSVSAAVQRGVESLLSPENKAKLGFASIEIIAATPVYQMTDEFYLQEPDGRYTVGDMGKWTLRPDGEFYEETSI